MSLILVRRDDPEQTVRFVRYQHWPHGLADSQDGSINADDAQQSPDAVHVS